MKFLGIPDGGVINTAKIIKILIDNNGDDFDVTIFSDGGITSVIYGFGSNVEAINYIERLTTLIQSSAPLMWDAAY
jgi:hypothetical protein